MIINEIYRFYSTIRTMLIYGLDKIIPRNRLTLPIIIGRKLLFWIKYKYPHKTFGERLRMALQELGPVWIKFGQMLSTRRDLFSTMTADQLSMLQDRVQPFDGMLARKYIEQAIGGEEGKPLETWFDEFQQLPLASASISQVHVAKLKQNGKEIVIKVIRPDILPTIEVDMYLMYRLARWISQFLPDWKRFHPVEIVLEYKKNLLDELNLLKEAANTIKLRRNFKDSSILYIPKVYMNYCRKNIMITERIYGVPINNILALKKQGTNMKLLAERGVQIFFIQVFRDSFFHGDMHPGNIFVSYKNPYDPQYIGIDCGIMGSLNKKDKRYLAENFLAFFNRDYRRIAELHVNSGWISSDTNIEDFEFAVRVVCDPIFEKSLIEISFGNILLNLFSIARRFNMEIQPQLILLQKTLLYIEGIGRQLYPQLDLWKTAKPFLETWLRDQISITAVFHTIKGKIPYWIDVIPELPDLIHNNFKHHSLLQKNIDKLILDLNSYQVQQNLTKYLFNISIILLVSGIFFLVNYKTENINFFSVWLIFLGIVVWIIALKKL